MNCPFQHVHVFKTTFSFTRYLVEQKEIELNVRDKWDSTPL